MSYTSSNYYSFSNLSGTAEPGNPFYLWKKYSYEPQGPVLYRLNMPLLFEQNVEILPVSDVDYFQQNDFNFYLNDAKRRYQEINHNAVFNVTIISKFLNILKDICNTMQIQPYIMFNKLATKIQLNYDNKEFVLDYDHEELDNVYILSSKDGTIFVKECTLDKLEETIRTF